MVNKNIKRKELFPASFAKPGIQVSLARNVRNANSLKGKKITSTKVRI